MSGREIETAFDELRWHVLLPTWAAERLGVQVAEIAAMIRDGRLVALPAPRDVRLAYPAWQGYLLPGWQFDEHLAGPHPALPALLARAGDAGWDTLRLHRFMTTRQDGGSPAQLLRRGELELVLARLDAAVAVGAPRPRRATSSPSRRPRRPGLRLRHRPQLESRSGAARRRGHSSSGR